MKRKYEHICKHCKKEILEGHVSYGEICMGCGGETIYPWFVSLYPDLNSGYYEIDIKKISEMLVEADPDDRYVIGQKQMSVCQYYNLPEFQGF